MIAYDKKALDNKLTVEQAELALHRRFITNEELKMIRDAHPVNFYRPNLFIRIGLFLATAIIVLMSSGLLALILGSVVSNADTALAVVIAMFSLGVYAGLEYFIHNNRHYRSGVDDALLWLSFTFLVSDLIIFLHLSELAGSFVVFILALYCLIRFANPIMAAVAYLSFLSIIFYGITPLGGVAKVILPFLTMIVSAAIYILARNKRNDDRFRHYRQCVMMIEFLSLLTTYASVNYFVVQKVSIALFDLPFNTVIPGNSFFWVATFIIPALYIWRAMLTKDRLLLRTGLLLVAAAVFTFRAYYSVAPVEQLMTVAGIVMMITAYLLIKYLRKPRRGIIDIPQHQTANAELVEGLVVAETLTPEVVADQGFRFGGGTTGGGGATGTF